MEAGYKLQDGGRIDVQTVKEARRVKVSLMRDGTHGVSFDYEVTLTLSEARAVSSALMGAAADA